MAIIIWILKAQWGFTVDRLTYEKRWSIERISNLLIGVINVALVLLSLLHQSNWLILLALINMLEIVSVMSGKRILHDILFRFGFQEKEKILQQLNAQARARE